MTPESGGLAVGILGRAEPRGLGYQSLDVARHVNPARVLLVNPTPNRWDTHPEWWAGFDVTAVDWPTTGRDAYQLPEGVVRRWLAGLDVVYSAETAYQWDLAHWAKEAGCALVIHANPELLPPDAYPVADLITWWAPTPWLLDRLPRGARIVPMPVDTAQASPIRPRDGRVRFVHVAGHQAHLDRNGTRLLSQAVARTRVDCDLTVTGQDGRLPAFALPGRRGGRCNVNVHPSGFDDRWDAYQGDVLILPRKYGGLCLPAQEAMACGMCVALPDCPPNEIWPGPRMRVMGRSERGMLGGQITVHEPDPAGVRQMIDWLAAHPDDVDRHQADARAWAETHSWEALGGYWAAALNEAARCRP